MSNQQKDYLQFLLDLIAPLAKEAGEQKSEKSSTEWNIVEAYELLKVNGTRLVKYIQDDPELVEILELCKSPKTLWDGKKRLQLVFASRIKESFKSMMDHLSKLLESQASVFTISKQHKKHFDNAISMCKDLLIKNFQKVEVHRVQSVLSLSLVAYNFCECWNIYDQSRLAVEEKKVESFKSTIEAIEKDYMEPLRAMMKGFDQRVRSNKATLDYVIDFQRRFQLKKDAAINELKILIEELKDAKVREDKLAKQNQIMAFIHFLLTLLASIYSIVISLVFSWFAKQAMNESIRYRCLEEKVLMLLSNAEAMKRRLETWDASIMNEKTLLSSN